MKKKFSVFVMILMLILFSGANCFAQNAAARQKALNGTWNLIAIMSEGSMIDAEYLKAQGISLQLVFSGDTFIYRKQGEQDSSEKFKTEPGYIVFETVQWPYYIQGKILLVQAGNSTFILNKK